MLYEVITTNSARFIYSLYDVGALEDVRLEFAMNIGKMEPSDLGVCGEPYAVPAACELSVAAYNHGVLGVGIAGADRPPSPWHDPAGLEFGGRIEWRWDRFSFALTDFYGYNDYLMGNYALAVDGFQDFLANYPESEYADNSYNFV